MPRITNRIIDGMTRIDNKVAHIWDDTLPGFGVKWLSGGGKRFVLRYRTEGGGRSAKQRQLILGSYGIITPSEARKLAQLSLAEVARGKDPQGVKTQQRTAMTMQDVWNRFESEHLPSRKPRTQSEYSAHWSNRIAPVLGAHKCEAVTSDHIDRFHKSMRSTPYLANRVLAILSRIMGLAETWHVRPKGSNPCRGIERFKETPRNRYLSPQELSRVASAICDLEAQDEVTRNAANAIKLLLLTGARLNEVLTARWEWVDLERHTIELPDSKGGARSLFLSQTAAEVLEDQERAYGRGVFIFPGPGVEGRLVNLRKPWVRICDLAGLEKVRLHDLRHTAASIAINEGTSLAIVGRMLGHTQPQTTQRYAHVGKDPALKAVDAVGSAMAATFAESERT
jgi:integrase